MTYEEVLLKYALIILRALVINESEDVSDVETVSDVGDLTPQSQLSLQGTFDVWMDIKVLSTKADRGEVGM